MNNDLSYQDSNEGDVTKNNYSLEVVDTIFADTLSRGMQNAIVSQQNSQMASSSSVTNACARILQAQANKNSSIVMPNDRSHNTPTAKVGNSNTSCESRVETIDSSVKTEKVVPSKALYLLGAAVLIVLLSGVGSILWMSLSSSNHL